MGLNGAHCADVGMPTPVNPWLGLTSWWVSWQSWHPCSLSILSILDSLSILEQVAELDGMLGTSLCSWLDGRLVQLPSSETGCSSSLSSAFFQEAAGSCLAEKSFLIFFFWHGEKLQENCETGHTSLQFVFNYSEGRGGNYNTPCHASSSGEIRVRKYACCSGEHQCQRWARIPSWHAGQDGDSCPCLLLWELSRSWGQQHAAHNVNY